MNYSIRAQLVSGVVVAVNNIKKSVRCSKLKLKQLKTFQSFIFLCGVRAKLRRNDFAFTSIHARTETNFQIRKKTNLFAAENCPIVSHMLTATSTKKDHNTTHLQKILSKIILSHQFELCFKLFETGRRMLTSCPGQLNY